MRIFHILIVLQLASTLLAVEPAPGKPCCAPAAPAPYTRKSLYQADAAFTTDGGRSFQLGELRGAPVILTMFFTSCGYACPLLVSDVEAIRAKLPPQMRDRAKFVLVSFDSIHDTPAVLAEYRAKRGFDDRWVLLHGRDDAVRELAALLGVKYQRDADGAYAHSNLITVLNSEGEIVHQRGGLKGGLDEVAAAVGAAR